MPPSKRTRSSKACAPAEQDAQAPAVDVSHLTAMLELLVKVAAHQQGIATVAADIEDIKMQLDASLAQQEKEAEEQDGEEDEDDGEGEDEQEGEDADAGGSTVGANHSTGIEDIKAQLCEIQMQGNTSKHEYGFAGNQSTTCGVCSSMWDPSCSWSKGKGNWACFTCQVYICKWDCLNLHNKEGKGNTVRGKAVIYTKDEWAEMKADAD